MKTKIILALLLITNAINAQPNTGQTTYGHSITGATLTSGSYVTGNPGFVMAGYRVATTADLIVNKAGVDGLYAALPGEFTVDYNVTTGGSNCNASQTVVANCSGVSIIETFQGTTQYAMAAGYEEGCLIVFLDNTGAVTSSKLFPYVTSSAIYSKPLITESVANPGNYYIVGSYWRNNRDNMYVIYTDNNFTTGWTANYDLGSGTVLTPRGIIESTYNVSGGELIVVGKADLNTGNSLDGFMIALDNPGSGTVNFAYTYYMGINDEWLSSIDYATNNTGFIVGGYCDWAVTGEKAWMANLDQNGGYPTGWWKIVRFNSVANAGDIVSVKQRLNTSSVYEYYGLAESGQNGLLVCKLDASGAAGSTPDEFRYRTTNTIDESVSLSLDNVASGVNEGIHVFGNTNNSPNEFMLQQACFNGVSADCPAGVEQFTTTLVSSISALTQSSSITLNVSQGLSPCTNYVITPAAHNVTTNQACYQLSTLPVGPPYVGNQNKTSAFTSLGNGAQFEDNGINIFPNPVEDKIKISISNVPSDKYKIEIVNALGQILYQKNDSEIYSTEKEFELDIETLELQDGFYILKIISGTQTQEARFLVRRN